MANILESYNITNPRGIQDECAKFTIDDLTSVFVLHGITTVDQTYTVSFWVRSEEEGRVLIYGNELPTSAEWVKYVVGFTADSADFDWIFGLLGTYYIYHPQLEIGTIPSDYTAAPEDTDDKIDETSNELHQSMVDQNAELVANYQSAISAALEDYLKTGDFEAFENATSNALEEMRNDVEANNTATTDRINSVEADLLEKYAHLTNWIHIDTEAGSMTFGSSENKITLTIENDMIIFKKNGEEFGWWDGVDFHTGNIYVEVNKRAQFGNFAFIPRSDGSLSFLKVGD